MILILFQRPFHVEHTPRFVKSPILRELPGPSAVDEVLKRAVTDADLIPLLAIDRFGVGQAQ